MGKEKYDNNLFMITINGHEKHYFTSAARAADYIGIQRTLMMYNVGRGKTMRDSYGNMCEVAIVDGSDIPYKLINNNKMEE